MSNQRTKRVAKALAEMRQTARTDIAKREILHFRVDENSILSIYEAAAKKKQPVGTLIREWVLDRLQQEQGHSHNNKWQDIENRLSLLEQRLVKPGKKLG